jgi:hypothetical protein
MVPRAELPNVAAAGSVRAVCCDKFMNPGDASNGCARLNVIFRSMNRSPPVD